MRYTLMLLLLAASSATFAQTPFEFAVVEDLIEGNPFISVLRIKTVPGLPVPGSTQLQLSTRAGLLLTGESCIYPDSMADGEVSFVGLAEYTASVPTATIERIFAVLRDCMDRFPHTGITDISLDVVSVDDRSWLAVECSITRLDSLLDGSISHLDFWRSISLRELEVGTAPFMTQLRWPGAPADYTPIPTVQAQVRAPRETEPWKSLILPGWGQLDAGVGAGWINLLVEAGGIALILSDEKEVGMAALGVNHLISFIDLF
jgi:hypothetical protein